jgi:hypothetical protein
MKTHVHLKRSVCKSGDLPIPPSSFYYHSIVSISAFDTEMCPLAHLLEREFPYV